MIHRVTASDNKWQRVVQRVTTNDSEWQRMTTSGTTSDNERQRVIIRDNEWQRVVILSNFPFLRIREEPTAMHPEKHSLNIDEDIEERLLK